jgi:hypothetical protein
MDRAGNSYVLGTQGPRMAVTRYTPAGQLDAAWADHGTYVMSRFTADDVADIPKAIVIDRSNQLLYVAGSSDNEWAVGRVVINDTGLHSWKSRFLTGTASALWLDTSENNFRLGVAGTSANGEIQVAVLYAVDTRVSGQPFHSGGTLDTSFGNGTGYATAPASLLRVPGNFASSVSVSSLVERDDLSGVPAGEGENEWLVSGTVTFSPGHSGMTRSRPVVVDFQPDGTAAARTGNGNAGAPLDVFGRRPVGSRDDRLAWLRELRLRSVLGA